MAGRYGYAMYNATEWNNAEIEYQHHQQEVQLERHHVIRLILID